MLRLESDLMGTPRDKRGVPTVRGRQGVKPLGG